MLHFTALNVFFLSFLPLRECRFFQFYHFSRLTAYHFTICIDPPAAGLPFYRNYQLYQLSPFLLVFRSCRMCRFFVFAISDPVVLIISHSSRYTLRGLPSGAESRIELRNLDMGRPNGSRFPRVGAAPPGYYGFGLHAD